MPRSNTPSDDGGSVTSDESNPDVVSSRQDVDASAPTGDVTRSAATEKFRQSVFKASRIDIDKRVFNVKFYLLPFRLCIFQKHLAY